MTVSRFLDVGPLEVEVDGLRVSPGGRRPALILTVLLLNVNRRVDPDVLVEAVWGDAAAGRRSTLSSHILRLRKVLEPGRVAGEAPSVLVNDGGGYRLVATAESVDSLTFEAMAREATELLSTGQAERSLQRSEEALALWRGQPFDASEDGAWAAVPAARLAELRIQLQLRRIDALLALGDPGRALLELAPALAETPLDEALWQRQMLAQYRSGRTDQALATFQQARRILDRELGIEPGPELRELQRRILQDPELVRESQSTTHLATRSATEIQLPARGRRLIGRDDDLPRLRDLITRQRVTTVVGAAGCGKTSLAVATAWECSTEFVDGIWFVDLTAATEPDQVLTAVAASLRIAVPPTGSLPSALEAFTRRRRMLLVLDNCEQVLNGVVQLILGLIGSGSELSVLATSREPMMLPEEYQFLLSPLALPGAAVDVGEAAGQEDHAAAVQLFLERLQSFRSADALDDDDLRWIEQICRAVDGLPLAIELAASRHRAFSFAEIADQVRIDASTLNAVGLGQAVHHRTLRSAIDSSYRLLSAPQQRVHRQLALVPGEVTVAAASAIAAVDVAEIEDLLASLVHRSLLTPRFADRPGGVTRFLQLATVRGHGAHKLTVEERTAAQEHLDAYVLDLLSSRARRGRPEEASWMESVDDNLDVIRAALQHNLIDVPDPAGIDLLARIGVYWYFRGRMPEARGWLLRSAALLDQLAPLDRALIEVGLGAGQCWRSRGDLARAPIRAALDRTDYPEADGSVRWGEQLAIASYAIWAANEAELGELVADRLHRVATITEDSDLVVLAAAAAVLSAAMGPRAAATLELAAEVYPGAVEVDNVLALWQIAGGATAAAVVVGDAQLGRRWSDRAVEASRRLRVEEGSVLLEQRANVAALSGDFPQAAQLYAAARHHQTRTGLTGWNAPATAELVDRTRAALATSDFEQRWQRGVSTSVGSSTQ